MARSTFSTITNPASIAVVGASRSPDKVGHQILKNIITGGFKNPIYPVNPSAKSILGLTAYPTLSHAPTVPEVAVIATPAPLVPTLVKECNALGVRAAIIITAGFSEVGAKGHALQQELEKVVDPQKTRVLGPNCLGVLSPKHNLNATFGPKLPKQGSVMLISQSGALVTGILDWALAHDLGLSHAVTLGNRIDIGENEALEFAQTDPDTKVVLLYLESFEHAPSLFKHAAKIAASKPVILLKGGKTSAGQSASASHTAALATNYILVEAFAKQTGVILSPDLEHWLTTAALFSKNQHLPHRRVAVITNAGGPGVITSDAMSFAGLELASFTSNSTKQLETKLSPRSIHNPLDLLGDAQPDDFNTALSVLAQDTNIDSLLVIVTPQTTTHPKETAAAIAARAQQSSKPLYAVFMGGEKMAPAQQILRQSDIPVYTYPNQAVDIITAASEYCDREDKIPTYPARRQHFVTKTKKEALSQTLQHPIPLESAFSLLKAYHFSVPRFKIVSNLSQVPDAVNYVGKPAIAKTANLQVAHKAAVGGVQLNLMTIAQARMAYRKLSRLYDEVLFQQTVHAPLEIILGSKRDQQMGTFITVGLGGALTNTINDREYAFIPTTSKYLEKILMRTKAFEAVEKMGLSIVPVIEALHQMSAIMLDYPQIQEMEINPAMISKQKLYAVDIKISLEKEGQTV